MDELKTNEEVNKENDNSVEIQETPVSPEEPALEQTSSEEPAAEKKEEPAPAVEESSDKTASEEKAPEAPVEEASSEKAAVENPAVEETSVKETPAPEANSEQPVSSDKKSKKKNKKKLPLPVRIILFPFKLILILLILLFIWFAFCYFNKTSSLQAIPNDYSLYLRTDSLWETLNPLLDIDASLVLLSSEQFQGVREPFLEAKKSTLRNNFFIKNALNRRFDLALYNFSDTELSAVGVLDASYLSGITRLVPFIIPRLSSEKFEIETLYNSYGKYYCLNEQFYFIIHKNLIIFTLNQDYVNKIMSFNNLNNYSDEDKKIFKEKLDEPLRIIASSKNIIENFSGIMENSYIASIANSLSQDEYTVINFGISQSDLSISASFPVNIEEESLENPVLKLINRDSTIPSLLPKLSDSVQYYTLINAGSLSELKDAAALILPPEKNLDGIWKTADNSCKLLFHKSLDEILFSWSADEFIAFGIEGKNEPVFGIKISDEEKRQDVFDSVFSSLILQTNDSLLVDGIRLPCIELPPFLNSIVSAFGINVPKPYYLVADGFIFFSQSPENLVSFNAALKKDNRLSKNENWKKVSSKQSLYSSVSLYYNLERSIPFFVKGNSTLSKIIRLYNIGRFDVEMKNKTVTITLQSSAIQNGSSLSIPGFPLQLSDTSENIIAKSNAKKSNMIFYIEKDGKLNGLNCQTFENKQIIISDIEYIVAASEKTAKDTGGEVWAITKQGLCFLLDKNLENVKGFPVILGVSTYCRPTVYGDSLLIAGKDCVLYLVDPNAKISEIQTDAQDNIRSTPDVLNNYIAIYEKGFLGGIHILKDLESVTEVPLEIDGIAYESPCLFTNGTNTFVAIVTQSGTLYVYDLNTLELVEGFPVELEDIFYLNVKAVKDSIFALSEQGVLYKVSLDGNIIKEKIPYLSAKEGIITLYDYDDNKEEEIFISGQGNTLYGFSKNMELLYNFPISGFGNPVFMDVNGDNKKDCLVVTFDSKLNAANVLK